MSIKKQNFGVLSSGHEVSLFTISNGIISFSAINYGCCITGILLPAKNGGSDDVVLGYSTLTGYIHNKPHFGSLIGRCAGRISNAAFSLDGVSYQLTKNTKEGHCLHGGYPAYDRQCWDAAIISEPDREGVCFSRVSPDGEQGFPGEVQLSVSYTLDKHNTIRLCYEAETTKPTPINLTNHTYFNLNEPGVEPDGKYISALNHEVRIFSHKYVETGPALVPTGRLVSVQNTPFDFCTCKTLQQDFTLLDNGYDGTWLLDEECDDACVLENMLLSSGLQPAAVIREPVSGRELHIVTTQPALTMYTANFLDGVLGKNGDVYGKHCSVCFETQHVPDSPNCSAFPSVIIYPGKPYRHETWWHFKI